MFLVDLALPVFETDPPSIATASITHYQNVVTDSVFLCCHAFGICPSQLSLLETPKYIIVSRRTCINKFILFPRYLLLHVHLSYREGERSILPIPFK